MICKWFDRGQVVGCINWMIVEVLDEGARPWWPLLVFPLPRPCYRPHDNRFVHSATVMMIPTYFLQLKTMVMMHGCKDDDEQEEDQDDDDKDEVENEGENRDHNDDSDEVLIQNNVGATVAG